MMPPAAPYDSYSAVGRRLADMGGPLTADEKRQRLTDLANPDWPEDVAGKVEDWARVVLPALHAADRLVHLAAVRRHAWQVRHLECGGDPIAEVNIARKPSDDRDGLCSRQLTEARKLLELSVAKAVLDDGYAGNRRRGLRVVRP